MESKFSNSWTKILGVSLINVDWLVSTTSVQFIKITQTGNFYSHHWVCKVLIYRIKVTITLCMCVSVCTEVSR